MRMASPTSKASGRLSSARTSISLRGASSSLDFGEGEIEGCSVSWGGVDPDSSSIAFNHAFTNGKPDAGALILLIAVKSFEYPKDVLLVLRIDPDPVVLHSKTPRGTLLDCRNVDARRLVSPVFERVADQVLKHLLQVRGSYKDL